jgi:nucleotide-binding universal stress UspA family protein
VHVIEIGLPDARADTEGMVENAVELLQARGLIGKGLVEVMSAATVAGRLAQVARASDAEVVVMGSRGLGRLGGWDLGCHPNPWPVRRGRRIHNGEGPQLERGRHRSGLPPPP